MKPFASFPFGGSGKSMRTIYPFIVVPLLALLVTLGALTYYLKSRATPATAPASTTWYFDAGSVGGGFQEYLTLQNPDPSLAANVTITYLIQTNPIQTKAVQHTIPGATRQTIDMDHDLGTSQTGPHFDVSAIVQVASGGPAIIAEQPWYFNALNMVSGTDAFGAVVPQKAYYFAEGNEVKATQQGQPDYSTFVAVLNPSSSLTAHATVTYYTGSCGASGQAGCSTQQLTLAPLQRQVMTPPVHGKFSISVVSSDNPIVAERPMYIKDNIANAGGYTTGAIKGVGATAPGTDWLFAEGYTGGGFQEYYELANFRTTAATAQIKLEYTNGATQTLAVLVAALGTAQFDVNLAYTHPSGTCVPSPCRLTTSVSAEITSNSPIVAERLMYFHFGGNHISGTTDVVGAPAAHSAYAFAEGYTLGNFTEFLTLQNPNATNETVTVTYFMTSTSFQVPYTVPAHSRVTVNVNSAIASRGGGAVSMLVQSQGTIVAERPIYFIYGSSPNVSQGGSDVIGFTGS